MAWLPRFHRVRRLRVRYGRPLRSLRPERGCMKNVSLAKLASPKKSDGGPVDSVRIEPLDNGAAVHTHFSSTGKGDKREYPEPQRLGFSDHAAMMSHLHEVT